ncbi:MAG: hypothetical protein JWN04_2527 [Myxococcaceae bacterium]|nr:hypothetical protein [Myxococcaceae bacterium]
MAQDAGRVGDLDAGRGLDAAALPGVSGPDSGPQLFRHPVGTSPANGQQVFRFETFGNEGYWTKVLELPQGLVARQVTPAQALALGLAIDIDMVPADLKAAIMAGSGAAGAGADPSTIPALGDPANTVRLLKANAIVGMVTRQNHAPIIAPASGPLAVDPNNVFAGESVGLSCALCHSNNDGSVIRVGSGGGIGHRIDGGSNHNLQFGKLVALANRSVAYYPTLALDLTSNDHKSVSRKGPGVALISATPSEQEVDAYLNDDVLYPVGMFDDQPDGNGAPLHNQPLFRTDLAPPWGSEGSIRMLHNFSNFVYTTLLDPTDLLISKPAPNAPQDAGAPFSSFSGAQYVEYEKAGGAGLELIANYRRIVEGLGISEFASVDGGVGNDGYPYVGRVGGECPAAPAGVENEPSISGLKCNQTKLLDMNAYLDSTHPPAGVKADTNAIAMGRSVFRQQCTSCHNDDSSIFVPENIVAFNAVADLFANAPPRPALFPAWNPALISPRPGPPFAPLVPAKDDATTIFDDKLIINEPSNYQQPRGDALPLLLDLARKPSFLHDDEVKAETPTASLALLLDPVRGANAPHPFYVQDGSSRAAVVTFLQSLDDTPRP